jgi:hypothetical protein
MEDKDIKIKYFTDKLNKLKVKQATFTSSGYKTPGYLERDIRLTELAITRLSKK